jgi:glycosidase
LSHDYLYTNPRNTVVFADNHDLSRYFSLVEKDLMKWKMGMAFLLTMRGTPMIYYGTEILMTGLEEEGHGYIREDFPGGWPGDPVDVFSAEGRSGEQEEAFNYLKELLNWRKDKEVIHSGNLVHFIPSDGLYIYCMYDDDDAVMVVLNNNDEKPKQVDPKDYVEVTGNFATSKNVLTGEGRKLSEVFTIPPKSAMILDLD